MDDLMRLDTERLRNALIDFVALTDSGGCGQYIVMSNAIAMADEDKLVLFAREFGLPLSRFATEDESD